MPPVQYQFKNLNHLGLVAAMCREVKIAEYFDARITNDSDARNVTIGQAVVAMIINGQGFTGQTLYLKKAERIEALLMLMTLCLMV
ncbi:DUF4277 domain-containing protein [Salinisphaera sp. G21_0]|nr:DUF4277 domain-containing protein [Salinisphaera sp. G21_0]